VIKSFADRETQRVFDQQWSTKLPRDIQPRALKKLLLLDAAESEMDLRSPPSNRLESLKGNRRGELSIRINRQWRICFRFRDGNAYDVRIEDYH
jgi:proteic killer suppression protein